MVSKEVPKFLLQEVKVKEDILKSIMLANLRPTDPLQTTVGPLPEKDSPCIVSLAMLATVIFVLRTWSPGKNTIVVSDEKNILASCAYLDVCCSGLNCEGR